MELMQKHIGKSLSGFSSEVVMICIQYWSTGRFGIDCNAGRGTQVGVMGEESARLANSSLASPTMKFGSTSSDFRWKAARRWSYSCKLQYPESGIIEPSSQVCAVRKKAGWEYEDWRK